MTICRLCCPCTSSSRQWQKNWQVSFSQVNIQDIRLTVSNLRTERGETYRSIPMSFVCAPLESKPLGSDCFEFLVFLWPLLWALCVLAQFIWIGAVNHSAGLQNSQRRIFESIYMRWLLYLAETWVIPLGWCSAGLVVTYRWGSRI